eukprot:TRINITY_DN2570_c0_g1_i1.p1 TRINITY_DN2570_c0_g1~~TRINITY_DN2570_c0_g1_i1.p1  ORF type:complete len:651 (-),score=127.63 TRINITY_DN2570_c0_g1_i1:211-2163(-)
MSNTAKRAEELANIALANFKEGLRPTIQRDLQMALRGFSDQIRKTMRDEILHDLKPTLQAELKEVVSLFGKELTDGTTAHVKIAMKEELKPVLEKIDNIPAGTSTGKLGVNKHVDDSQALSPFRSFKAKKATVRGVKMAPGSAEQRKNEERKIGRRTTTSSTAVDPTALLELAKKDEDTEVTAASCAVDRTIHRSDSGERRALMAEHGAQEQDDYFGSQETEMTHTSRMAELMDAAETLILSESFELAMTAIIVANAISLGLSTNWFAQHINDPPLAIVDVIDAIFFVIFLTELLIRIFVYRKTFFIGEDWGVNIFDFCLVVLQFFDVLSGMPFVAQVPGGSNVLNTVRGLRLLRVVRLLRIVRLIRFVSEMRMIASSLAASVKSLFGAMLLLLMVLYLFGVCLTQMVSDERKNAPELENAELDKYFGSLGNTMTILYMSITGGVNWIHPSDQLSKFGSPLLNLLYVLYTAFCVFAIMNVVTGVFVGQAMASAQEDQDVFMVKNINGVFKKTELTSGQITWEEFSKLIHEREMVELFKAINIDVSEAMSLFRLLDVNELGVLDHEEFMTGCLRLRGPAKSLELSLLMRETDRIHQWSSKKFLNIESLLGTIISTIGCEPEELRDTAAENDIVRMQSPGSPKENPPLVGAD